MQAEENIWVHFGLWPMVVFWVAVYGLALLFMPFYRKMSWKPKSAFMAFIVAFAIEMHGIPFGMYLVGAIFGKQLPEWLWGHTLGPWIGANGILGTFFFGILGFTLIFLGWRDIHKHYWVKEDGTGRLVTEGIYAYIRHPQYTGVFCLSLAMLCEWTTVPLLVMLPFILWLYWRLAKREEKDMEAQFGREYVLYRQRTGMFLPRLTRSGAMGRRAA
ncbi:MAG TPA: isoprenylcysteine carboxylmethyltransferase family protein [Symbiobacteriaceae bacterium]|nr:isoprenylcysteine carboxylmethyltransferase family protein [Symbiobacteriaceae bacterium]